MTRSRQSLGRWGEQRAEGYLREQGYQIVARNARTPYGELDLVARDAEGGVTVFVEVKTRRSSSYGQPEDAITHRKRSHLLNAARAFLIDHPELDGDWRVDVIAIQRPANGSAPVITHFENAVMDETG